MKLRKYISIVLLIGLTVACDRADDCGPVGVMDASALPDATALDARIRECYEKYKVIFKYDFDIKEYEYNWTESLAGMPYTPADPEWGEQVIDSIEKWVFKVFPDGFIEKYLQPTILLVDSVKMEFCVEHYDTGLKEYSWYALPGNISKTNITIANVSNLFEPVSQELKEAWISLFVERMMFNNNFWPRPVEFEQVNGGGTNFLGAYWNGNYDNRTVYFGSYPEGHPSEKFEWWTKGILKPGRLGCDNYTLIMGMEMYSYWKCTLEQDFADYVAFIVNRTAHEKEEFWQTVIQKAGNQGYDAQKVLGMMKRKMELVQQYFKSNFGFELTEPQK